MRGWLLDTNVVSELRKSKPDARVVNFIAAQPGETLFTSFFQRAPFRFHGCFRACRGCVAKGSAGHLENPRRLGLDLFTYQRMEPFAGGKIDLDTEALLKQSLGRHQIQRIESPAGHSR